MLYTKLVYYVCRFGNGTICGHAQVGRPQRICVKKNDSFLVVIEFYWSIKWLEGDELMELGEGGLLSDLSRVRSYKRFLH
jgi:hypothetical protein